MITGSSISISSTYIVFVTKMQKRQTPEKGFALFKNDITTFESTFKTTEAVICNSVSIQDSRAFW
jgi:hypothetical protein